MRENKLRTIYVARTVTVLTPSVEMRKSFLIPVLLSVLSRPLDAIIDDKLPCPTENLKFLVLINCQTYTHQYCLGVLVTPVWVLTAATCISAITAANLQDCSILHPVAFNVSFQPRRAINATKTYPAFAPESSKPLSHNIGLLQLSQPIDLSQGEAALANFQTQEDFVDNCRHGIIPGSNLKHTQTLSSEDAALISWYHCCYATVVSGSNCEGYRLNNIDGPNCLCTPNENYLVKPRDIGTPLVCYGADKKLVVIGLLSSSQRGRYCLFTRVDRYFKFLERVTGKAFAFKSEPSSSSDGRFVSLFCVLLLAVLLLIN